MSCHIAILQRLAKTMFVEVNTLMNQSQIVAQNQLQSCLGLGTLSMLNLPMGKLVSSSKIFS